MAQPVIDFVALGGQRIPQVPSLRCLPLADPNCAALYRRRREAVDTSPSEWMCFVDGGEDALADDFVQACEGLAARSAESGVQIGFMAETEHGKPERRPLPHHGVVCNVRALRAIPWPDGVYHWEALAYGVLMSRGYVRDPTPRYDWRPGPGGARLWPTTRVGFANSVRWLGSNGYLTK